MTNNTDKKMGWEGLCLVVAAVLVGFYIHEQRGKPQAMRPNTKIVIVEELLNSDYRETSFRGNDGYIYYVYSGSYQKGDKMQCEFHPGDPDENVCDRLPIK